MPVAVTDTHPLIWYATAQKRKLSRRALHLFEEARRGDALIYVPAVALWEIGMLLRADRIGLEQSFRHWTDNLLALPGFELVPLDSAIILAASELDFPAESFDAAIVATALVKDLPLITKDSEIVAANVVAIEW